MAYKCIVVATIPLHSIMASRDEACSCPTIKQAVTLHPRQDFKRTYSIRMYSNAYQEEQFYH